MTPAMTIKFVLDNILYIGAALLSGGMLLWPIIRGGIGGAARVNTLQATMMINQQDALILDVREPAEYARGHILNARNIPLAQLDSRAGDLQRYKSKPIIVHDATGTRAAAALSVLKKKGFDNVAQLNGGFAAWLQAGLPVAKLGAT